MASLTQDLSIDGTIVLVDGPLLVGQSYHLGDEIVLCRGSVTLTYTDVTQGNRWRVERGQDGTTPATHSSGTALTLAQLYGEGGGGGGTQEVYVQDDDPGAVGAGKLWVQTVPEASNGLRLQLWARNADDDEWLSVGAADSVLGVVEAPGGTGLTRYDAAFTSLADLALLDSGGTVGNIRADIMRSPGGESRAFWHQTDTGIRMEAFDDNEDSGAAVTLTPGGVATVSGVTAANLNSEGLATIDSEGGTRINSDVSVLSNNNAILTNPPIAAPASHVADGATVDDLRDALVAAGLMEPAP